MAKKSKEAYVPRDLYAEVSAKILAELEKGTAPWVKPWKTSGGGFPRNAVTKRAYSGTNVFLLWMSGFSSNLWLSYKQANDLGGHVRKGEKGTMVIYMNKYVKKGANPDGTDKDIWFLKSFTVFNVTQCENLPDTVYDTTPINHDDRDEIADEFVATTGAVIKSNQDRAYYSTQYDHVGMPRFEDFNGQDHYYATLFHELGHWTGHTSRLDRKLGNTFGSEAYAGEEMIAELCAAYICAEFGYDGNLRHAAYIESWIKLLKNDSKAFVRAASAAQKAANYLRDKALGSTITIQADETEQPVVLAEAA